MHFFKRSSNSPRYLLPATRADTSSVSRRLPRRISGTWLDTMSCAKPSATAVLPTPGSPISSGLFFWRRERICMTRSISPARPMTGSSLPSRAFCVRSVPNSFRALSGTVPAASKGLRPAYTGLWPTKSLSAVRISSPFTPRRESTSSAVPSFSRTMPSSRCSVEI